MSIYSIKDLERYSGIKAGTLRIWESRYKLLSPQRSSTNIRYYSDDDLRHIMNVGFLNKQGIKISKIADLSPKQINEKVLGISEKQFSADLQIEQLFIAMLDYKETLFEEVFANCVRKIGFEDTMIDVIYPFLQKLGVMWHAGTVNPSQEHFILQLIRQKLVVAIDSIASHIPSSSPRFLLYLPENEFHELALLFYNYWLRSKGYSTVYLGQSVPYVDVKRAYSQIMPDFLLTVITCPKEDIEIQTYLNTLSKDLSKARILITGSAGMLQKAKLPSRIFLFKSPQDFDKKMAKNLLT